jgi:hypothetical protein
MKKTMVARGAVKKAYDLANLTQIREQLRAAGVRYPSESTGPQRKDVHIFHRRAYAGAGVQNMTLFNVGRETTAASHSNMPGNGTVPGKSILVVEAIALRVKPGFDCLGARIAAGETALSAAGAAAGTDHFFANIKQQVQQIAENCTVSVKVGEKVMREERGLTAYPWFMGIDQDGNSFVEGITATGNGFRYSDAQLRNGPPNRSNMLRVDPFMLTENDQFNINIQWDALYTLADGNAAARGFIEALLVGKYISNN